MLWWSWFRQDAPEAKTGPACGAGAGRDVPPSAWTAAGCIATQQCANMVAAITVETLARGRARVAVRQVGLSNNALHLPVGASPRVVPRRPQVSASVRQTEGVMRETTIYSTRTLRAQWPAPLADQWLGSHPDLFDEDDRRLALAQPDYHFNEWFAAVHLFTRDGVLSLVEKYCYGNHSRKADRLRELLSGEDCRFVYQFREQHGVQPPDLLVYSPGQAGVSFAEVKGPRDVVSDAQRLSWDHLARRFNTHVELINVVVAEGLANNEMQRARQG